LRKSSTSPENRAALVRILDEETDHLDRLVNDLLSYALPLRPQVETVNIKQLAKASAADHLSGSPHLNIECEFDTEAGPDTIDGDRELLKQALDQLLMNAADAMPSGGTVRIRTTATELDGAQAIGLSVIDTGPGMGDAIKSQALDPFFTTRATSSGLGLAIVQKVAQSHEGALTMSSEEGHGTTVTLTLRTAWPAPDAGSDIDTSPPLNLSP
jgi:signal transduction histidine kinase